MATRRGGGQRGLNRQGGDHSSGEDKRSRNVATRMWVKLDSVTKDRAHGTIEGHEVAPNKLAVVEEGMHSKPDGDGRSQEQWARQSSNGGEAMEPTRRYDMASRRGDGVRREREVVTAAATGAGLLGEGSHVGGEPKQIGGGRRRLQGRRADRSSLRAEKAAWATQVR
jgi:hypothetical protein